MGTEEVDWPASWRQISQYPNVSFIPEVWQGHKDHRAGFWEALSFLGQIDSQR